MSAAKLALISVVIKLSPKQAFCRFAIQFLCSFSAMLLNFNISLITGYNTFEVRGLEHLSSICFYFMGGIVMGKWRKIQKISLMHGLFIVSVMYLFFFFCPFCKFLLFECWGCFNNNAFSAFRTCTFLFGGLKFVSQSFNHHILQTAYYCYLLVISYSQASQSACICRCFLPRSFLHS